MSTKMECPHCRTALDLVGHLRVAGKPDGGPVPEKEVELEVMSLIEFFRRAYLETVDRAYRGFKKPYPAAEVRCARRLLKRWPVETIHAVINWTVGDRFEPRPGSDWSGWGNVIRSVANLDAKFSVLESRVRAAMQGRTA